jgi:hypothetical protein
MMQNPVTRYVALIPEWFKELATSRQIPVSDFTNLSLLEDKLSVQDVCFYVAYHNRRERYLKGLTGAFKSFTDHPQNDAWLTKHRSKLQAAEAEFDTAVAVAERSGVELSEISVPVTVRRTSYVPCCVSDETIAFMGVGSWIQFEQSAFLEQTLIELNKMMTHRELEQSEMFKLFCALEQTH